MPDTARDEVQVHAAPAPLRACSPCLLVRRVAAGDAVAARVHANSFACLNVVTGGSVQVGGQAQRARFLVGPLSQPRETLAEGRLVSASLVLQPWVLEPWFGWRPDHLADRLLAPGAELDTLCDALAGACERPHGVPAVWEALGTLARSHPVAVPELALSVLRERGVEAAAASLGCSARHYRRRFQRAFGLGPAAWLRVRRWEEALQGLLAPAEGEALAGLSAAHGYADQAHFARDTRAFVQASPARLRAGAQAGWSLAPARVRILQDGKEPGP